MGTIALLGRVTSVTCALGLVISRARAVNLDLVVAVLGTAAPVVRAVSKVVVISSSL